MLKLGCLAHQNSVSMKTIFVYIRLQRDPGKKYHKYGNITSEFHCIAILLITFKQQYLSSSDLHGNSSSAKTEQKVCPLN
jgi:hypothetical protein